MSSYRTMVSRLALVFKVIVAVIMQNALSNCLWQMVLGAKGK